MEKRKLDKWAELLLDTGKRSNLVNFKDTRGSTVEVVLPSSSAVFKKALGAARFVVFDPKIPEKEDDGDVLYDSELRPRNPKAEYIEKYSPLVRKSGELLLYSALGNPMPAVKNIFKKAKSAIEETGVNLAYMAFGFIHWWEGDKKNSYRAPILLSPITFEHESALDPYHIKTADDEIILNPTFSYKLASDYGIKLPEYEDGELCEYLDKIAALLSPLGYSVSAECKIGIFSFQKINMYRDICDNADRILNNPNVRAILGEESAKGAVSEIGDISRDIFEFNNIVDADSSQLEAIEMAKSGQSFVLEGPPGTGKSQTITNIIAECLSDGKKVLFVSEKLAALNVVYEKLKAAGLEEFCLELHSHKANKKDFIEELCRTLRKAKSSVSGKAEGEMRELLAAKEILDGYRDSVHKVRPVINKSLFEIYNLYSSARNYPDVDFVIDKIEERSASYYKSARDVLVDYAESAKTLGDDYRDNPWYGYIRKNASYKERLGVRESLEAVSELCRLLSPIADSIGEKYYADSRSIESLSALADLFAFFYETSLLPAELLSEERLKAVSLAVGKMRDSAFIMDKTRKKILSEYESGIFSVPAAAYKNLLRRNYQSFWRRLFSSEYRGIIKELRALRKNAKKPSYTDAIGILDLLSDFNAARDNFLLVGESVSASLGDSYKGEKTALTPIKEEIDRLARLLPRLPELGRLGELSSEEFEKEKEAFGKVAREIRVLLANYEKPLAALRSDFDADTVDFMRIPLSAAAKKCEDCLSGFGMLDEFTAFLSLLEKADSLGLRPFIDFALDGGISPADMPGVYKKAFFSQKADYIIGSDSELSSLPRIPHDRAVEVFSRKDEIRLEIVRARIRAELSAKRPSLDMIASGSAVAQLLREGEKKRKQKSIRALLSDIGDLIEVLKPCFLMSPLSVSTYLGTSALEFDVVVFDEASQIFPQDAVGAIYRAKQVIVVGDSKQMPPSNFFSASVDSEEDSESDAADFESILDVSAASMPSRRLRWHYRSQSEELIAFSNKNFYDGELVTFPAPEKKREGLGVDYYFAGGVFEHKTRVNRREAELVVDLIYENIKKYPERSLGVVAFSISQQNLIDRLLSKRREAEPDLEEFFRSDKKEPFFIKNLETVQGDERDTVIFSVAYAKDSEGKLLHNFGPLNREGGERRLNVAVTRAKKNVKLVSSMHYTDIDLTRTKSEGARLLREYLEYAERGGAALADSEASAGAEEFGFENAVADFLTSRGYRVQRNIGSSEFKIDIAVRHPGGEDFALAIECDGDAYRSAKNARDRDRLRRSVLRRMGWRYYRIWSTDWFRNPAAERDRLILALEAAIRGDSEPGSIFANGKSRGADEGFVVEKPGSSLIEFPIYKMARVDSLNRKYPNDFQAMVREILLLEAPLSEEWLLKRVCHIFGREKVTGKVIEAYEREMLASARRGIYRKGGYLYLSEKKDLSFRIPDPDDPSTQRELKYISPEELSIGLMEIIKENVTVEKQGLYHTAVNLLGFARVTPRMVEELDRALILIEDKIDISGSTVSLAK